MSKDKQQFLSVAVDSALLAELDSYADAEKKSRSEAVRELLTYALADKKADLFGSPIAAMVTRIMRSELIAFRQVQEEAVEADRELIIDTFSEILAASDASLLYLTSLIAHPGSETDPEDLFNKFRIAGRLTTAGYPYKEALQEADKVVSRNDESDTAAEAW